ncbi:MAG TPA: redoxin domain-containing protein [Rickettsiales bacterium]|nr:redoxin domain-containing protein [Rickettsiales bacterium]
MRSAVRNILISLIIAGMSSVAIAAELTPGQDAPDFTAKATDGTKVKLSSLKGKIVVLDWANYGCPFDHMHYSSGNLPTLQEKYTQKGIVWLSVMSSAPGKQGYFTQDQFKQQNTENHNHATHVLMDADGKIGHLYGAKTTPHIFVIDPQGKLAYEGAIDSVPSTDPASLAKATPFAANAIDAVLAGQKPNPDFSPSYGCSIKY